MNELKVTIANNIANLRKLNGITQSDLAQKLNYSDKAVSKWERGESLPDICVLKQIADIFGVTVDYLLDEHAEKNKEKYLKQPQIQNKIIIVALWVSIVWIIATIIFVYVELNTLYTAWSVYVWAVPVSALIVLAFNNRWGTRKGSFWIASVFIWSLLASIYIQLLQYNTWMVFLVGIPIQIAIILWANIKPKKTKKQR